MHRSWEKCRRDIKSLIRDRFQLDVEFGDGNIVYKETILEPVEGVGHFEPLRHYAEVHLLLEPAERGSGLTFYTVCSEDVLDRNWQRLILTHLEEKKHPGVLTGSEITDMKITLLTGRAHIKHTEGGDFRQATYRAVRQGLRKAKSILLEPVYEYRLELPADLVGRAMADIQRMNGNFSGPELDGETAVLTGTAPVSAMRGYPREVTAYSRGRGRLSVALKGYEPCHNSEEIVALSAYDPEGDMKILWLCFLRSWSRFCGGLGSGGSLYAPGKCLGRQQSKGRTGRSAGHGEYPEAERSGFGRLCIGG